MLCACRAVGSLHGVSDAQSPADWYPDPFGRHEKRYWDGTAWTEHVVSHGSQSTDPPTGQARLPQGTQPSEKVQEQVARSAEKAAKAGAPVHSAFDGDGTIFGEPILVVNQKAKLIELSNEYAIYDQSGHQMGAVRQTGQSGLKKVARFFVNADQFFTHVLQVVDMSGTVQLQITRPRKLLKSRVLVADGAGREIGRVVQQNVIGKISFSFEVDGQRVGGIFAENWRAWDFSLQDAEGVEIGRISKTWEGVAKTMFTTADNYVLHVHHELDEPLRSLVVASALTVDTALKQDNRGLS